MFSLKSLVSICVMLFFIQSSVTVADQKKFFYCISDHWIIVDWSVDSEVEKADATRPDVAKFMMNVDPEQVQFSQGPLDGMTIPMVRFLESDYWTAANEEDLVSFKQVPLTDVLQLRAVSLAHTIQINIARCEAF